MTKLRFLHYQYSANSNISPIFQRLRDTNCQILALKAWYESSYNRNNLCADCAVDSGQPGGSHWSTRWRWDRWSRIDADVVADIPTGARPCQQSHRHATHDCWKVYPQALDHSFSVSFSCTSFVDLYVHVGLYSTTSLSRRIVLQIVARSGVISVNHWRVSVIIGVSV